MTKDKKLGSGYKGTPIDIGELVDILIRYPRQATFRLRTTDGDPYGYSHNYHMDIYADLPYKILLDKIDLKFSTYKILHDKIDLKFNY